MLTEPFLFNFNNVLSNKFKKPEDFNPEGDCRKPVTGTKPVDLKSHINGTENSA